MPDTHDAGRLFTHSLVLDQDAPIVHKAFTAEYDDPCRHSPTLVIKTRFRRRGRWHGIRKSWLSVQVKLPTGPFLGQADSDGPTPVWGIVLGWWRTPKLHDEWAALIRAMRLGHEVDEDDEREFEDPEFDGTNESRGIGLVSGRRTDAVTDSGLDA